MRIALGKKGRTIRTLVHFHLDSYSNMQEKVAIRSYGSDKFLRSSFDGHGSGSRNIEYG